MQESKGRSELDTNQQNLPSKEINGLYEEEKDGNSKITMDDYHKKKRRTSRKVSDLVDDYVPFSYNSPTLLTSASPNKVLSNDVSDEIGSSNSNEFSLDVQLMGEQSYDDYNDSKSKKCKKKPSTDSSDLSPEPKSKGVGYTSDKNILRVEDL